MKTFHIDSKRRFKHCKTPGSCIIEAENHLFETESRELDIRGQLQHVKKMKWYGPEPGSPAFESVTERGRRWASQNPDADPEVLELLSRSRAREYRLYVAMHKNTKAETLNTLSADPDPKTRSRVAKNLGTSPATLQRLARDEVSLVRFEVAKNSNTPQDILQELSRDEDSGVRASVAQNINATLEIFEQLARDESQFMREYLLLVLSGRKDIHPWDKAVIEGTALSMTKTGEI